MHYGILGPLEVNDGGIQVAVRTNTTRLGALGLSLLLVGFLVVSGSRAAFTATTDNPGNSWAAGTVALSDDDGTPVIFNAAQGLDASLDFVWEAQNQ